LISAVAGGAFGGEAIPGSGAEALAGDDLTPSPARVASASVDILEISPEDSRLPDVFEVMGELRAHLSLEQFRDLYVEARPGGYRVVGVFDGDSCRAVAGYRIMTNLISGKHMYVDDLVTAEKWRSHGYGRLLNKYLGDLAQKEGCTSVQLDSATHRHEAHRFYFRERYAIRSFHFVRLLER
jgi:GNAT superfamily N-acetyltransferase